MPTKWPSWGSYAYVADDRFLQIIDVSDPAAPSWAGGYSTSDEAGSVAVLGSHAYVACYMGGLTVLRGATLPGDLDYDCDVDLSDLAMLLSNYGTTSGASYEDGDLDADGDVDLSDLAALLAMYGTTCS